MIVAPCRDCVDRYEACHAHCEKYKQFELDHKEDVKKQKKYNQDMSRTKRIVTHVKKSQSKVLKCHKK